MRLSWLVACCATAMGAAPGGVALAQGLLAPTRQYGQPQPHQTPGYRPPTPSSLDKNYGLPRFGMPGAELPKQRATATAPDTKADAPSVSDDAPKPSQQTNLPELQPVPDFFAAAPEITLPKVRANRGTAAGMDTPLFTTSDGSALNDMETSTGTGMTTGDAAAVR
jgi:hypothetical protein